MVGVAQRLAGKNARKIKKSNSNVFISWYFTKNNVVVVLNQFSTLTVVTQETVRGLCRNMFHKKNNQLKTKLSHAVPD